MKKIMFTAERYRWHYLLLNGKCLQYIHVNGSENIPRRRIGMTSFHRHLSMTQSVIEASRKHLFKILPENLEQMFLNTT